jgi:hypothetical protein
VAEVRAPRGVYPVDCLRTQREMLDVTTIGDPRPQHMAGTLSGECDGPGLWDVWVGERITVVQGNAFTPAIVMRVSPRLESREHGGWTHIDWCATGDRTDLPSFLLSKWEEIHQWEESIKKNDPSRLLVYADWCEENGWTERATELRRRAEPPEPAPVVDIDDDPPEDRWYDGWDYPSEEDDA